MNKEEIIAILDDWNFWKKPLPTTFHRPFYEDAIKKKSQTDEIIILKGVRRSGKSTILLNHIHNLLDRGIAKEQILFVNLEDPRFAPYLGLDLLEKIKETYLYYLTPREKPHIILDEIQNIEGFEKWLLKEYELKRAHLYITGSNSKLLSREIGSALSGRYLDTTVYPLSFKEFLHFKKIEIATKLDLVHSRLEVSRLFEEYTRYGGFPKVVLTEDPENKSAELKSYFDSILLRDIVARYRLDQFSVLEKLAVILISQASNLTSINKLKNLLGVSHETIEKYFEYLQNAYIIFSIPKFDWSLKKQTVANKKIYTIDPGLSRRISFEVGKRQGDILENILFLELRRRHENIYYYKTKEGYEVDFLIKEGEKIVALIQVTLTLSEEKTRKRELRALKKAQMELGCQCPLIVLTMDRSQEMEGVRVTNAIEWLLEL